MSAPDAIVVGGGPAGATAALLLGRQGFRVDLFEKRAMPGNKPCGEGILPAGVAVLERLGLRQAVGGLPLRGVRYHRGGDVIEGVFSPSAVGWGVAQRRTELDRVLWDAATRAPGVRAEAGVRVDEVWEEGGRVRGVRVGGVRHPCRLLVVADGARSPLRRRLGLEGTSRSGRVGLRAHFALPKDVASGDLIEIFLHEGYEIYTTPLPRRQLLVAMLGTRDTIQAHTADEREGALRRVPGLGERLTSAKRLDAWQGSQALGQTARSGVRPGAVLLGDAAFNLDPLTANGIAQALVSAEMLAQSAHILLGAESSRADAAGLAFDRRRRQEARGRRRLTTMLLFLLGTSRRVATTWWFLRRQRWLVQWLLRIAAGGGRGVRRRRGSREPRSDEGRGRSEEQHGHRAKGEAFESSL